MPIFSLSGRPVWFAWGCSAVSAGAKSWGSNGNMSQGVTSAALLAHVPAFEGRSDLEAGVDGGAFNSWVCLWNEEDGVAAGLRCNRAKELISTFFLQETTYGLQQLYYIVSSKPPPGH